MLLKGSKVSQVMLMVLGGLTAQVGTAAAEETMYKRSTKQVKKQIVRKPAVARRAWRQEIRPAAVRVVRKRKDYSPKFLIGGNFGGLWSVKRNNGCQVLNFDPNYSRMYVDKTNRKMRGQGEILIGLSQWLMHWGRLEYGFAFSMLSPEHYSGRIWEQASPEFDNSVYSFKSNTKTIGLMLRSIWPISDQWAWYVGGRAGLGLNYAYDYQTASVLDTDGSATPLLGDHLNTSFAGAVEAGFEYALTPELTLTSGYRYDYFGKVGLGRASGDTLAGSSLSHTAQRHGFAVGVKWRAQ